MKDILNDLRTFAKNIHCNMMVPSSLVTPILGEELPGWDFQPEVLPGLENVVRSIAPKKMVWCALWMSPKGLEAREWLKILRLIRGCVLDQST